MNIKQFEDINLAHFSYAIVSNGEMALIDPSRNPKPYYDYAKRTNSKITTVIETHPHADFVSSHLEIHNTTGASIYVSKLLDALYDHATFDDGDAVVLGDITLKAINTPGHSPDSISVLLLDELGKQNAVFTGDTLFIGDCGRPDLRENAGALTATRIELAKMMYHSLREKLMKLDDNVLIFPAHGAGSLCGKELSKERSSTMKQEKTTNWSLQNQSEESFVKELDADQPFIPKYFTFNVAINRKGAEPFEKSVARVEVREPITCKSCVNGLNHDLQIIDTRPRKKFNESHLGNAINLINDNKFETWLGSIIGPDENFYLVAESNEIIKELIERIAKIGYETNIEEAFTLNFGNAHFEKFDSNNLRDNESAYTIIDIRNQSEVKRQPIFKNAINIPLYELRERTNEIPLNKPILIHCAGGYRSAAGRSILHAKVGIVQQVNDLSEDVKLFYK